MYPALWLALKFLFGCENLRFSHNQVDAPIRCGFLADTVLAVRRVLCPWRTDTAASNLRRAAASDSPYNDETRLFERKGKRPPDNSELCSRLNKVHQKYLRYATAGTAGGGEEDGRMSDLSAGMRR